MTDVRGWVVAHAIAIKQESRVWLIGSHPSPSRIRDHIDRYIIREEATVSDLSTTHHLFAVGGGAITEATKDGNRGDAHAINGGFVNTTTEPFLFGCPVPILGDQSWLWCGDGEIFGASRRENSRVGCRAMRRMDFLNGCESTVFGRWLPPT